MKNALKMVVAIAMVTLATACEKDWTCRCDTSGGEIPVLIKGATEEEAAQLCSERAERKLQGHQVIRCDLEGEYKR